MEFWGKMDPSSQGESIQLQEDDPIKEESRYPGVPIRYNRPARNEQSRRRDCPFVLIASKKANTNIHTRGSRNSQRSSRQPRLLICRIRTSRWSGRYFPVEHMISPEPSLLPGNNQWDPVFPGNCTRTRVIQRIGKYVRGIGNRRNQRRSVQYVFAWGQGANLKFVKPTGY